MYKLIFLSKIKRFCVLISSVIYRGCVYKCGNNVHFERVGLIAGGKYMSIGDNTSFQQGIYLTAWDRYKSQRFTPQITVGTNCSFGAFNHISCINKIIIGNGLLTGKWVTISDNNHGGTDLEDLKINPQDRELISKGIVRIFDNVFLGDKSTVLSGVTIGEGAVIAAKSVVTHDIPPYCVAAGVPAKIIKRLNNN